jgi:hypothetical protein
MVYLFALWLGSMENFMFFTLLVWTTMANSKGTPFNSLNEGNDTSSTSEHTLKSIVFTSSVFSPDNKD